MTAPALPPPPDRQAILEICKDLLAGKSRSYVQDSRALAAYVLATDERAQAGDWFMSVFLCRVSPSSPIKPTPGTALMGARLLICHEPRIQAAPPTDSVAIELAHPPVLGTHTCSPIRTPEAQKILSTLEPIEICKDPFPAQKTFTTRPMLPGAHGAIHPYRSLACLSRPPPGEPCALGREQAEAARRRLIAKGLLREVPVVHDDEVETMPRPLPRDPYTTSPQSASYHPTPKSMPSPIPHPPDRSSEKVIESTPGVPVYCGVCDHEWCTCPRGDS